MVKKVGLVLSAGIGLPRLFPNSYRLNKPQQERQNRSGTILKGQAKSIGFRRSVTTVPMRLFRLSKHYGADEDEAVIIDKLNGCYVKETAGRRLAFSVNVNRT